MTRPKARFLVTVLLALCSLQMFGAMIPTRVLSSKSQFVSVENGHFLVDGKRLYLHGVNYLPLYAVNLRDNCRSFWLACDYRSSEVASDLTRIKSMGMNLIVIRGPDDNLVTGALANLRNLLNLASEIGLYVLININMFDPNWPSAKNHDIVLTPQRYHDLVLTMNLANETALLGYDLAWELTLSGDTSNGRQNFDTDWTNWIIAKYGSLHAAESAWSWRPVNISTSPLIMSDPSDKQLTAIGPWTNYVTDYWRFAYDYSNFLFGLVAQAVRAVDPNHLLTVRNGYGGPGWIVANTHVPADPAVGAGFLDFLSPEGYGLPTYSSTDEYVLSYEEYLARLGFTATYTRWATGNSKPILFIEFGENAGVSPTPKTLADQKEYYHIFYSAALRYDVDGVAAWWYPGGLRTDEQSDYGIVNPDGSPRPVDNEIKWYASELGKMAKPIDSIVQIPFGIDDPLGFAGVYNKYLPRLVHLTQQGQTPGVQYQYRSTPLTTRYQIQSTTTTPAMTLMTLSPSTTSSVATSENLAANDLRTAVTTIVALAVLLTVIGVAYVTLRTRRARNRARRG